MFRMLHDGWSVTHVGGPVPADLDVLAAGIPATVPGVVHLDLLAAGLIDDPHLDDAESRLHWIGESDWEYRLDFDWVDDGSHRHDLVVDGIDTVATILVNGTEIARTANQHRAYRFDIRSVLRTGENALVVRIASPSRSAREQEQQLGARPHVFSHPYNAIRKAACNFGWDWGIDLATSGIWQRIGIESWSGARLAAVRPLTDVADGRRDVDLHVDLEWDGTATAATLSGSVAGTSGTLEVAEGTASAVLALRGVDADLWWPRTHGAQPLYDAVVELSVGDAPADADRSGTWRQRIGFRSVALDLSPDEAGSAFRVLVNDEPVYIRGANWIPDDTLLPRLTRDALRASIADAVDADMNLLRVWGGGIYESEDFYALCDEVGMLVWQDFLTACAAYAEEEPLWSEFEAEARQAVSRLSAHPSLAIWNGCNENIWGYVAWDWRRRLGDLTWGEGYYTRLFPGIVAELAPGTPFIAGSPFSFSRYLHPNDDRHGIMHIWDVWNELDYDEYRRYRPRFVSEFGFQGPPAWSTLERAVHDEVPDPFGPQLLVHQKAEDGNGKLRRGLGDHLPYADDLETWHWTTQLNQARAIVLGIEWFRSLAPHNAGAIVWQLNDCWPSISWAAVDSFGQRKPVWYALRRVFADRLITVQPAGDGELELVLHNDHAEAYAATLRVDRARLDGTVVASEPLDVAAEARGSARRPLPASVAAAEDPADEYLVVRDGERAVAFRFFAEDPALDLRDGLTAEAAAHGDGYVVRVEASTLMKDVTVLADKVHPDCRVDDALVTLTAGETHVFRITGPTGLDPDAFTAPGALRSANELIVGARQAAGARG
jgi:beta-mannosidase